MEFSWKIASRTGESYTGIDEFPKQEYKDSANTFELSLSDSCLIQAPYGMNTFGNKIELTIPDGETLVFKRRVRVDMCAGEETKTYTYIIAFEKV